VTSAERDIFISFAILSISSNNAVGNDTAAVVVVFNCFTSFCTSLTYIILTVNSVYVIILLVGQVIIRRVKMRKIKEDFVKLIVNENSIQQSTTCLMEECAELIQALCKLKREDLSIMNLTEEISHVLLMVEVVCQLFTITDDEIASEIEKTELKMHNKKRLKCNYFSEQSGCIFCTRKCSYKEG
jgi:NTP pyrophosphatase (non-canonical NTP hydrolase)